MKGQLCCWRIPAAYCRDSVFFNPVNQISLSDEIDKNAYLKKTTKICLLMVLISTKRLLLCFCEPKSCFPVSVLW